MTKEADSEDYMTSAAMGDWFRHQSSAIVKAADLRTQEAASFVQEYSQGKISPEEAQKRLDAYNARWGDSVNGIFTVNGKTDKDILEEMDASRSGKWLDFVKQRQETAKGQETSPPSN